MRVITIGSSPNNNIVINDKTVSRNHCQIIQDNYGNFRLIDKNSTNGTYVNGVFRQGEVHLNQSDIIQIGNTTLPWQSYFMSGGRYYPPPPRGSGFGVAALVCGILGLFCLLFIFGLLGIIFGGVALHRKEKNKGLGVAGLVLGIVGVVFDIIIIVIFGTFALFPFFLW